MTPQAPPAPFTIRQLLEWTAQDLASNGAESPRLDAELLLARALKFSRTELLRRLDDSPGPEALARFQPLAYRRSLREPVAYILGEKPFHEITLRVSRAALIPRPETETLVEECLRLLRELSARQGPSAGRLRVLDLGTGCGTIALALAHAFPEAHYLATDLSAEALTLARENAERLGLSRRVTFRQGDRFAAVAGEPPCHLIACNPPYIPTRVLDSLMPEASVFEPRLALDGGPEGLSFIASILPQAPAHLVAGGFLVLEVGDDQAATVAALAPPELEARPPLKDLSGADRVLKLTFGVRPQMLV
ncbi:MAG: protein-(glutamine-N5) methyltransferase, release factor-specific [Deltaproteobacteria bacterium RBG_13_61_14]|nr:MAG: protein-(glutamine-N5) methyltransferase, release factor-specific [Deltaproteobacteria bacterium RBG_13_61_14]